MGRGGRKETVEEEVSKGGGNAMEKKEVGNAKSSH